MWHPGFRLTVEEMARHRDYRGPEFVELAREIAPDGLLTPRVIGQAVATGKYDPQSLKRVWHYVALFGAPPSEGWFQKADLGRLIFQKPDFPES